MPARPEQAIAVWARVWQVHEQADLRVLFWWDLRDLLHGSAELRRLDGTTQPLTSLPALVAQLEQVAVHPQSSTSPHGLLLAGNRAMQAEDFAEARECYLRARQDLPHHPVLLRNLALAQARLDNWEAAAEEMRAAREEYPGT